MCILLIIDINVKFSILLTNYSIIFKIDSKQGGPNIFGPTLFINRGVRTPTTPPVHAPLINDKAASTN